MTKAAALQDFFSGFGMTAYASTAVPDDVTFPYLTYTLQTASFGDSVALTVKMWFYTKSEKVPNEKAEELYQALGIGGKQIACDAGTIWLKRGTPFCISQQDGTNPNVKLRYINITAEFHTTD